MSLWREYLSISGFFWKRTRNKEASEIPMENNGERRISKFNTDNLLKVIETLETSELPPGRVYLMVDRSAIRRDSQNIKPNYRHNYS